MHVRVRFVERTRKKLTRAINSVTSLWFLYSPPPLRLLPRHGDSRDDYTARTNFSVGIGPADGFHSSWRCRTGNETSSTPRRNGIGRPSAKSKITLYRWGRPVRRTFEPGFCRRTATVDTCASIEHISRWATLRSNRRFAYILNFLYWKLGLSLPNRNKSYSAVHLEGKRQRKRVNEWDATRSCSPPSDIKVTLVPGRGYLKVLRPGARASRSDFSVVWNMSIINFWFLDEIFYFFAYIINTRNDTVQKQKRLREGRGPPLTSHHCESLNFIRWKVHYECYFRPPLLTSFGLRPA